MLKVCRSTSTFSIGRMPCVACADLMAEAAGGSIADLDARKGGKTEKRERAANQEPGIGLHSMAGIEKMRERAFVASRNVVWAEKIHSSC
jgi:hypothetical protein